jgi:hypothetical protein
MSTDVRDMLLVQESKVVQVWPKKKKTEEHFSFTVSADVFIYSCDSFFGHPEYFSLYFYLLAHLIAFVEMAESLWRVNYIKHVTSVPSASEQIYLLLPCFSEQLVAIQQVCLPHDAQLICDCRGAFAHRSSTHHLRQPGGHSH